jgi:hypothetical protein
VSTASKTAKLRNFAARREIERIDRQEQGAM